MEQTEVDVNKRLLMVFASMKLRCYNPSYKYYCYYGARGVTICKEWLDDRGLFLDWAKRNGYKQGLQIDKDIKQGNGLLYSPGTCCWVTPKQNIRFRRNGKLDEYKVKDIRESKLPASALAKKYDVNRSSIYSVLKNKSWV